MPQLWHWISPQTDWISTWGKNPHPAFLIRLQNWRRPASQGSLVLPQFSFAQADSVLPISQQSRDYWPCIAGGWRYAQLFCWSSRCCPWKSQRLCTWISTVGPLVDSQWPVKNGSLSKFFTVFLPKWPLLMKILTIFRSLDWLQWHVSRKGLENPEVSRFIGSNRSTSPQDTSGLKWPFWTLLAWQ